MPPGMLLKTSWPLELDKVAHTAAVDKAVDTAEVVVDTAEVEPDMVADTTELGKVAVGERDTVAEIAADNPGKAADGPGKAADGPGVEQYAGVELDYTVLDCYPGSDYY